MKNFKWWKLYVFSLLRTRIRHKISEFKNLSFLQGPPIELRFYVPHNTKYVISETWVLPNHSLDLVLKNWNKHNKSKNASITKYTTTYYEPQKTKARFRHYINCLFVCLLNFLNCLPSLGLYFLPYASLLIQFLTHLLRDVSASSRIDLFRFQLEVVWGDQTCL